MEKRISLRRSSFIDFKSYGTLKSPFEKIRCLNMTLTCYDHFRFFVEFPPGDTAITVEGVRTRHCVGCFQRETLTNPSNGCIGLY